MKNEIKSFGDFSKYHQEMENKKIAEEKSSKQESYAKFFKETLAKYDVSSPSELSDEKKKEFFDKIEKGWTKEKE